VWLLLLSDPSYHTLSSYVYKGVDAFNTLFGMMFNW